MLKVSDCVVCGATVESLEEDKEVAKIVDGFIEGHLREKASSSSGGPRDLGSEESWFGHKLRQLTGQAYVEPKKGQSFLLEQAIRVRYS